MSLTFHFVTETKQMIKNTDQLIVDYDRFWIRFFSKLRFSFRCRAPERKPIFMIKMIWNLTFC